MARTYRRKEKWLEKAYLHRPTQKDLYRFHSDLYGLRIRFKFPFWYCHIRGLHTGQLRRLARKELKRCRKDDDWDSFTEPLVPDDRRVGWYGRLTSNRTGWDPR